MNRTAHLSRTTVPVPKAGSFSEQPQEPGGRGRGDARLRPGRAGPPRSPKRLGQAWRWMPSCAGKGLSLLTQPRTSDRRYLKGQVACTSGTCKPCTVASKVNCFGKHFGKCGVYSNAGCPGCHCTRIETSVCESLGLTPQAQDLHVPLLP